MSPRISVITLVYNTEKYLPRCLESILAQDFNDFEILLVVEDNSTDNSVGICQEYAAKDKRIRVFHEKGTGFIHARNVGLQNVLGNYICFVDADDYIMPGMFSQMYSFAEKNNLDIINCGAKKDMGGQAFEDMVEWVKFDDEIIEINAETQRGFMYKWAVRGRAGCVWGKLYRREFMEENKFRFHPDAYSDDVVFNFNCFTAAKRVGSLSGVFYIYFDRHDSRLYLSNIHQIELSHKIWWELYKGYAGAAADDVRAFASVRIISSVIFNLKLQKQAIETICFHVQKLIEELELHPYLDRAVCAELYAEYAQITKMSPEAADSYYKFIQSLCGGYESILKWQSRYIEIEEKEGAKWTMR